MASNTQFAPTNTDQYSAKDLNASHKGTKFTAIAGQATSHDLAITDDVLIDGGVLVVLNGVIGDKITFQVVDIDNIKGYGANTVLGQYKTDWYINPQESVQLDFTSRYPAKVFAGLYLRVVYTSTGSNNLDVIVNYKLQKVLW